MAFKCNMLYTVEWVAKDGTIYEQVFYAKSASKAEEKAEKVLAMKPEFSHIEHVELDD